MTKILLAAGCLLLSATLSAQPPPQTAARSAGLGAQAAESNQDANIRAYIELLRADVRKSKSQIVGEVMQLDSAQASKFWPIYQEFETLYAALGDRIVALVRSYTDQYDKMTDAVADQLAGQVLSIEQDRNALKKQYYERFKASLGAVTAMRFVQVENQLERIIDLQIAAELPIAR